MIFEKTYGILKSENRMASYLMNEFTGVDATFYKGIVVEIFKIKKNWQENLSVFF